MKRRNLALPPTTTAECPEAQPSLTLNLTGPTPFNAQLDALLPQLRQLDDAQLLQLALHARHLETCAFRLRGACVAELRRRITTRLTGGRGLRDTTGSGVSAQLARLATQIGVSLSTLKIDARIHELFFTGETRFAREPSLAREYYVIALGAPDPLIAIRIAYERCSDPSYRREQFRRDVLALKQSIQPDGAAATAIKPKSTGRLRVKILPEAEAVLAELVKLNGQTPEAIVSEALLAYHKLLQSPDTAAASSAPGSSSNGRRSKPRTPAPDAQPSLPLSP